MTARICFVSRCAGCRRLQHVPLAWLGAPVACAHCDAMFVARERLNPHVPIVMVDSASRQRRTPRLFPQRSALKYERTVNRNYVPPQPEKDTR